MPSLAQHFSPGTIVGGRYRIEAIIGQGGFGAVFRATQLNLDRPVALKALLPEALGDEGLARFQREAEIVQRLEHPNVVRLLDFGVDAGADPYLVFELLQGQTLEEAIRAGGPMPPARAARIAAQILKALMEAHARGVVHRDIKPANVFLCSFQGEPDFVKVLDFGIAKGAGSRTLTQRGGVLGTPAYMAPEQVTGGEATFATDLYALALSVEEAITGRQVYADVSLVDIVREHVSPNPVPHDPGALASPLGPVIQRASQKAPEQRYASAAEMLAHVEAVLGSTPASGYAPAPSLGAGAMHTARGGYPSGAFAQASMQGGPLVPPAPSRAPKKKGGGAPWAIFAAIGAGVVALGGALVAVLAMGGGGGKARGSAAPSASGAASDAAGTSWPNGSRELEIVETNVNGDAVPDFAGYCTKSNASLAPYEVCAVDGATFRVVWRRPAGFDVRGAGAQLLGAAGRAVVFVDGGGVAHLFDAATGNEQGAVRLGGHADRLCAPPDMPGKLWIKMKEARGVMVDTAAKAATDAPRPASCRRGARESGCYGLVDQRVCPPDPPHVAIPGFGMDQQLVDGGRGVALAGKNGDPAFRVMIGFDTRPHPHDDHDAKILWQRPLAPGDGLGAVGTSHYGEFDASSGRAVAAYDDPQGATHIVAVDEATGRTLWDVTSPAFYSFVLSPSRLYENLGGRIEVRDAATGRVLGGIGGQEP
jgi:eukaryotic-like serine/threonine-protein kinase